MNKQLVNYMTEVMTEAFGHIPISARGSDIEARLEWPYLYPLRTEIEETIALACKARREGAKNRAEAIEWAFDSLIRNTGYVRMTEVYRTNTLDGVPYFSALVRERDPLE